MTTTFSTPNNIPAGANTYSVAVGDFNGDGNLDIVAANAGDQTVTVLSGDGAGVFTASTVPVGSTLNPINVFVGDFDGDGDDDIATANFDLLGPVFNPGDPTPASDISILLNDGSGSFSPAGFPFAVPDGLSAVALGDFNNDGFLDVAAGALDNNDVSVYFGDGLGTFDPTPLTYTIGATTRSLAIGDVNNDGLDDLAIVRSGDNSVFIRLGTGTDLLSGAPQFSAVETSFAVGSDPRGVEIVDINDDGNADLVVANSGSNNVSVLLGNGSGGFALSTDFTAGSGSRDAVVADFDGNGLLDIVTANETGDNISVLWNSVNLLGTAGDDTLTGGAGNDTLRGSGGNDLLIGAAGNDNLLGAAGDDTLIGGLGDDTLDGSLGADSLVGGAGNDLYIVDNLGDVIVELPGEGIDTVRSTITFTLGANLENLTLLGTDNINGTGNALDNLIIGNSGNNILNGGLGNDSLQGRVGNDRLRGGDGDDILTGGPGNDTLTGGTGNDIFRFNNPSEGIDRITDFVVGEDKIVISASNFGGGLLAGALDPLAFRFGAGPISATTSAHLFIYNTTNGALSFDVDGVGGTARVQIATIVGAPALSVTDFVIV
jgi:Ca2+-binding RTX toxin-like protein